MLFGEMDFNEHRLIIDGIDLMQRHVKLTSSQPPYDLKPRMFETHQYFKPKNLEQ